MSKPINHPALFLAALLLSAGCHEKEPVIPGAPLPAVTAAPAVESSVDPVLQAYGQELLSNKAGALVALDPATGEILAMVSSPGADAVGDPSVEALHPGWGRCVSAAYPAGSVSGIASLLAGLQDGVVRPRQETVCDHGLVLPSGYRLACHGHKGSIGPEEAVMMNCSTAMYDAFRRVVENPAMGSVDAGLDHWSGMVRRMGFGRKTGCGLPGEIDGYVPSSRTYDRLYGKGAWNALTLSGLAAGEGGMTATPLQLADFAAAVANRGHYHAPHAGKGEVGERTDTGLSPEVFAPVVDGMYRAVNSPVGTGGSAWIAHADGLDICGVAGSAGNPGGEDAGVFIGFAPREHPRIAVAVYIENGRYGSAHAAPIGSLVMERYLTGSVSRRELESRMKSSNLLGRGIRMHAATDPGHSRAGSVMDN